MADRYWVGGTGNWNNTARWSTTSGGAGGASVPTSSDNAFFNGSSGGGTATINVTASCLNIDFTGYTGTLAGSNELDVYGDVTLASGMTITFTGDILLIPVETCTFTSNGKTLNSFMGIVQNSLIIADNFVTTGQLYASNSPAVITTTSADITCRDLSANGADLELGSGTWTITGAGAGDGFNHTSGGLTAGTSTIKFTNTGSSEAKLNIGYTGDTYYNVWFARGSSTGLNKIYGFGTFNDIKDDGTAAHTLTFEAGATNTVNSFTVSGQSCDTYITVNSSSAGSQTTLHDANGGFTARSYLAIKDLAVTGSGTWQLTGYLNLGNTSGWSLVAPNCAPVNSNFLSFT